MMERRISDAVDAIRDAVGDYVPRAAVVLGSGLGGLVAAIENRRAVPFREIPHFAPSTASGHRGEIIAGFFGAGKAIPVVVMSGRLHCYEGWSYEQVTFPVAVLAALGAKALLLSNAAGGLNPNYRVGDMMVLRDHINLIPRSPAVAGGRGAMETSTGDARLAGYGLGMHDPYDPQLAAAAMRAARHGGLAAWEGTYLATLGPTYETRAEYRMMRRIGADAVGMSTVPEVIEARRQGMRVLAVSMISNLAPPDVAEETSHEQVLEVGRQAEPRLRQMLQAALHTLK